jgi:AcrR family transcriptional regulator
MQLRADVTTESGIEPAGAPRPSLSVRERSKQRRRTRIKEAARTVFIERGYEAATTREIAERADVSLGTLFAYAPTKSELLLMIVNDDIEPLRSAGFREAPANRSLVDVLMAFCEDDMAYWGRHPEIARQARREIGVVLLGRPAGPEAVRFASWKPLLLADVAELVAARQRAGRLSNAAPPELVADLWWAIYNQHLHNWLMDERPNLRNGVQGLRALLELAIRGLNPSAQELEPAAAKPLATVAREKKSTALPGVARGRTAK